jgi:proteic killer suppression protein
LGTAAARCFWPFVNGAKIELGEDSGNHLEELADDRTGQYSIRINDQYQICFTWTVSGPDQVEIVDYD